MLKNYFKIALRHFNRNRKYVLINVLGMGIAFAWCILSFVNYQFTAQSDQFHEHGDKIFRVLRLNVGHANPGGRMEGALAPEAVDKISAVQDGVRIGRQGAVMRYEDKIFNEWIDCVDPSFLQWFSFPLISGDSKSLSDPSKIILSKRTAEKYFGQADPIGRVITAYPGTTWQKEFQVGACSRKPSKEF